MVDLVSYFKGAVNAVKVVQEVSDQISVVSRKVTDRVRSGGTIVFVGIGKSGHICKKVAGSFNSYGVKSIFLHAAECAHGDLGALGTDDTVVLVSRSGASGELFPVLEYCQKYAIPTVAISSNGSSALARQSNFSIIIPKMPEASPHQLAPTYSTLSALTVMDAMFIYIISKLELEPLDFHRNHPGGALGQLGRSVKEVMQTTPLPTVHLGTSIVESIAVMSQGMVGCVGVIDGAGNIVGIFTDGDLRRKIQNLALTDPIENVATRQPMIIDKDMSLADLVKVFRDRKIPSVFVCQKMKPVGIVHIRQLTEFRTNN